MSYRSLLVHLDASARCDTRTQAAISLAKRLNAHLTGLAPTGQVNLPAAPETAAMVSEMGSLLRGQLRDQAERVASRFEKACDAAQFKAFEATVDEDDAASSLIQHARCHDLTVVTQADPSAPGHRQAQDLVTQLVLQSAQPTLLVPYVQSQQTIGEQVMVAWDGSREASRALADAMALLKLAKQVHLVSWAESGAPERQALRCRLEDAQKWLSRHGIDSTVSLESPQIPITEAMLSRASELGVDMIVMGAYGHSRWVERILGGATRGLLDAMTVPVLMSH